MRELLKFNTGGQWSLHKVYGEPPKDENTPNKTPFKSYSQATAEGRLREDRGRKGMSHNFGGGQHPKPAGVQGRKHWGKPAHRETSVYADAFPGSGD